MTDEELCREMRRALLLAGEASVTIEGCRHALKAVKGELRGRHFVDAASAAETTGKPTP